MTPPAPHALVVEDDASIALIVETVLAAAGYAVRTCATGEAALAPGAPDARACLLVTDLTLPGGIGGVALSRRLRERDADLAVVYMSGALDEHGVPDGAVPGAVALGKPFRRAALLDAVARARAS